MSSNDHKAPETSYCCDFESNVIEALTNTSNNLARDDDNTLYIINKSNFPLEREEQGG